jgi:outer membrane immunogenic protein
MKYETMLATVSVAGLFGFASASLAGGLVEPVTEPAIVTPVAAAPKEAVSWEGLYAGGSVGYGFNGDDDVGIRPVATGTLLGDAGKLDVSGANLGVHLGYRWQLGTWVFGPELGYQRGDVSDTAGGTVGGTDYAAESTVSSLLALRMKAGVLVARDLLIYGQAGVARAEVDYRLNGTVGDYTTTGYTVGLGLEKKLGTDWSVLGEYEYVGLGKEERIFNDISTQATPSHHSVKIGLNYQF